MNYLVVCTVALAASALTLYSGFGLGTLLLPAFALVFPVELAVSATAVVHLLNNLFKLWLIGSRASLRVMGIFVAAAIPATLVGAWLLTYLAGFPPFKVYAWLGGTHEITGVKLLIAVLIAGFATLELSRFGRDLRFHPRWLPAGGALSGFFGGLSGHQGALRTAFLLQCGLSKESFIGTGVAIAVLIDVARLTIYGGSLFPALAEAGIAAYGPLLAATGAAFAGAWLGVRLLGKVTMTGIRKLVGVLLLLLAVAMASGLI